ncbi:flavin reductase family protein [Asticcacaulis tiandongensis]|uniref:flavin reductase family protein n=1 Tax=Asticcacaulis tiandongensis TaxID=2565365 RepID=UPI001FE41E1F|nr:flavin reductase family protein [Asticcacaulis tiandongensis]
MSSADHPVTERPLTDHLAYRHVLGTFATGVAVVTVLTPDPEGNDRVMGMTINSFASVSLEPKLVLWSLGLTSERYKIFAEAKSFGINILTADQQPLADRFFREYPFVRDNETLTHPAEPLHLHESLAWVKCRQYETRVLGDHLVIVGEVEHFAQSEQHFGGHGLTYFRGRYGQTHPVKS